MFTELYAPLSCREMEEEFSAETEYCRICGSEEDAGDLNEGFCRDCLKNLATPENAVKFANEKLPENDCVISWGGEEEYKINAFFVQALSEEEINAALLQALKAKVESYPIGTKNEAEFFCLTLHMDYEFAKFVEENRLWEKRE